MPEFGALPKPLALAPRYTFEPKIAAKTSSKFVAQQNQLIQVIMEGTSNYNNNVKTPIYFTTAAASQQHLNNNTHSAAGQNQNEVLKKIIYINFP